MVVLDDVHWAEETLLDLIEYLAGWTRGVPLLLVCAARPELLERRPSVVSPRANASTLLLQPLAADSADELMLWQLDAVPLSRELRERILTASEGNPLVLVEDTKDWFAQDTLRKVWYLGEDTIEFPSGSTEGSWESGVNDADGGFIMLTHPQIGDRYFQEFAPKVAIDEAKVLSRSESLTIQGVTYRNVLLTKETSQLDPAVIEYKYYAPGKGFIKSVIVKGGDERTELVSITPNSGCN
jgi:hypothetical protein